MPVAIEDGSFSASVTATGIYVLSNPILFAFQIDGHSPIRIIDLYSVCITANDGTATTIQWTATGDLGGQVQTTITGVSASLAAFPAGGVVYCNFTSLATAPVITQTTGVFLYGSAGTTGGGVVTYAGQVNALIGTASSTGTWQHFMRWVPLGEGAVVRPNPLSA